MVRTLLKLGANPEAKDASGKSALDHAAAKKVLLENALRSLEGKIARGANPKFLEECLKKVNQVVELLSTASD